MENADKKNEVNLSNVDLDIQSLVKETTLISQHQSNVEMSVSELHLGEPLKLMVIILAEYFSCSIFESDHNTFSINRLMQQSS
jgi:hypothetical protein